MGKTNKTVVCDSNKGFEMFLKVGDKCRTTSEDTNFYKIDGLWYPKELFHDYEEEEEEETEDIQKPIGTLICDSVGQWTTLTVGKEYPYYGVVGKQYYELYDDLEEEVWAEQELFHKKEVVTIDDGEEVYRKDKPWCDGRCLTDNCRACKDAYEMGEPDTVEEEDFSLKSFVHGVEHGTITDYIIVGTRVNGEGILLSTVSEEPAKDLLTSALNCLLEADGVQIKRTTDEAEKLNTEDLRDIESAFPKINMQGAETGRIHPEALALEDPLKDYLDWFKKGNEFEAELLVKAMMTKNLAFVDKALDLIKRQEIASSSYPTDFTEECLELNKLIREYTQKDNKEESDNA